MIILTKSLAAPSNMTHARNAAAKDASCVGDWVIESGGPHQIMASVAVNRNGVVGLSYYESGPLGDDGQLWPTFTYSKDGGDTWSKPIRVTAQPFTTHHVVEWEKAGKMSDVSSINVQKPIFFGDGTIYGETINGGTINSGTNNTFTSKKREREKVHVSIFN